MRRATRDASLACLETKRLMRDSGGRSRVEAGTAIDVPALLARAKARPALLEDAVRTALRDAIAWRIGGGNAPSADAFSAAAVVAARQRLDTAGADATERSRTLAAVQQTAKRFIASALGRRLMTVPAARFVRLPAGPSGPDAVVRDSGRRLHAVVLRLEIDAFAAGRAATAVAGAIALPNGDLLNPLTIHVFSLARAQRYAFVREAARRAIEPQVA